MDRAKTQKIQIGLEKAINSRTREIIDNEKKTHPGTVPGTEGHYDRKDLHQRHSLTRKGSGNA